MRLKRAATLLLLHGWVAVGRNSSWLAQLAGLPHHNGWGGQAGAKEICLCPEKTLLTASWLTSLSRESGICI